MENQTKEKMESTIDSLKALALKSWPGKTGEERAASVEQCVRRVCREYSEKLGYTEPEIMAAIEAKRTYCAVNYYQDAKFPSIEKVRVFKNQAELMALIPSKKFRCPSCAGLSGNPYECDTKATRKDGSVCDWKAFGLFRTMGEGLQFTFSEGFLENGRVDEIFMPVEFETAQAA